jgi:aminopeptidase YwaD
MKFLTVFLLTIAALLISACSNPADDRPMTIRVAEDIREEFNEENALVTVAVLDEHIRWPGNVGFDASIDYVVAGLEAAGYVWDPMGFSDERLTYRVEEYPMDTSAWQPLGASIWIDGDSTALMSFVSNRNMLAYNSYSTIDGGVLLEVVDAGDGSSESLDAVDVRGKAVLANREINGLFEDAVVARGAAGVLAYAMPAYTQPEKNRNIVQFGDIADNDTAQSWGISLSFGAQEKLRDAIGKGDVHVKVATRVQWNRAATERTVIAEVRGSELPDERFVFSAHLNEPGANDNASGVAAQLEMARTTAALVDAGDADPKRTVTFLWGDEFTSTERFVEQDPGRREFILWAISMDMVGQDTAMTGGTFLIEKMPDPSAIWTRGEESFSDWGGQALSKDQLLPHYLNDVVLGRALEQAATNGWVVKTNPFEGGSDHVPFIEAGIPSLLLWHFTDQYYHTDLDRLDMVSGNEMKNVGVTALTTALTLTSADTATTLQLVEEVQQAATDRIRTETSLSIAAIRAGGSAAAEREILQTWADWYDDALVAMQDIEVGGASVEVRRYIDTARIKVGATLSVSSTFLGD